MDTAAGWTPPADDRLLVVDPAATLHIYAASTGAVVATYPNLVPKDARTGSMRAFDGICGWTSRVAVCPDADGFTAWRMPTD